MIGQTISHYRVLEKIGAGGMGVVYRAHDERLDRDVALKVLPMGSLASRIARTGFRKEAIALAKLNHPNIAAIYEFDAKDEVDFLVMEIISGVTLSTKMSEGPLPTPDSVAFGVQITAAVEEAHACGIIHRDLKPGNIMVTSKGQAKVLDFGLARFFRTSASAATESVTEMYHAAGTLAYMAPEILRGKPADPRSDIWSVGVVLYEMTTGTLPFIANNQFELSSLILREEPLKISDAVPSLLREVIARCLEKEPQRRFQCISDVRLRLQSIYSGTLQSYPLKAPASQKRQKVTIAVAVLGIVLLGFALTSIPRRVKAWLHSVPVPQGRDLAVLPFSTPNDDPQTTAFEYGLAETLATRLTQLTGRGGIRTISAPANKLKIIQQKLNHVLRLIYRTRTVVHGFALERSIVTNASSHAKTRAVGAKYYQHEKTLANLGFVLR